ncbi:MAG: ketopantoate reductase C-terminal domain-containing protein [Acidimicrobiales bacterium]
MVTADDWLSAAWTKLMLNAASGGICVIAEAGNEIFARDSEAAELAVALMDEVAMVGPGRGCPAG